MPPPAQDTHLSPRILCPTEFLPTTPVWLWGQQTIAAEEFAALAHARGFDRHSLLADPKFVSAARHDYRLAPDSPARMLPNQGKAAGALSD